MTYILGEDRILYIKVNGQWLPIGCLTTNSFSESVEMMDTTTRDNQGWSTSIPLVQQYEISFEGIQINTTMNGGNFGVASYDKLKLLKRDKILLEWKIQGSEYPTVDYGKFYITSISDSNAVGEFIIFSGSATGFGKPLTTSLGTTVLNNGDPNVIVNNGTNEYIIRTSDI
jgi:hypothetical protein